MSLTLIKILKTK